MLTDAISAFVNNLFKENFYEKRKEKKAINVLTIFFIHLHSLLPYES